MNETFFFQLLPQNQQMPNVETQLAAGLQNLTTQDDKAFNSQFSSASQVPNLSSGQNPPPFLSGVPMVNPGYTSNTSQGQEQPQVTQQPMSQAQSVVSNMAAYSSSKYLLSL